MNNDVELIPVKGVLPTVQAQSDNVIYVPQAHKNKAGIVKEGEGINIENGVVSLDTQTVEDMIDANKWVSYGFQQNLTEDEKGMARHNIGAGDNDFTGSWLDLANRPQQTIDFAESERQKSKNLFDTTKAENVGYNWNGTIASNNSPNYISCSFIKIKPNTNYIFSLANSTITMQYTGALFYTLNKTYISHVECNGNTFITPSNAEYMICQFWFESNPMNYKDIIQIEEGSVATNYQPYNGAIVHDKQLNEQLSNPNLLINGDFRVNQRGKTSYTGTGYTVDRWRNVGFENLITTPINTGISLVDTVDIGTGYILSYKFEDKDYLKLQGKTVTMSFKVSKNTGSPIYIRLLANGTNVGGTENTTKTGIFSTTITLPTSLTALELHIRKSSGELNCEIEYVKLELGGVATANNSRPYAEELAMCQRYYQNINTISSLLYARTTEQLRAMINFKTEMRTTPTLTQLNAIRVYGINEGTTFTQTSVGIGGATAKNKEGAMIALLGFSGLTEKYIYQFDLGVSTEPIFTADAEIY